MKVERGMQQRSDANNKAHRRTIAIAKRRKMNGWARMMYAEWKDEHGTGILGRKMWVYTFEFGVVEGRIAAINDESLSFWVGYSSDQWTIPWTLVVDFGTCDVA